MSSKTDALWVIPCKFSWDNPIIFQCVNSIMKNHDRPNILVVDSGSEDRSYLEWCLDHGCKVAPINNKLYSLGAHGWATRHYAEFSFFYLIMDSLLVTSNLDEYQKYPVTAVRHFSSLDHDWGWDVNGVHLSQWGQEQLDRMGVPMHHPYNGVMGPMLFMQDWLVEQLDHIGFWFTQTDDKFKLCGAERVAGIVLEHLGHDMTRSLQGPHIRHESDYPEDKVRKLNMARM